MSAELPRCSHCGKNAVQPDAICSWCLWDNIAGERAVTSRPTAKTVREFIWPTERLNYRGRRLYFGDSFTVKVPDPIGLRIDSRRQGARLKSVEAGVKENLS